MIRAIPGDTEAPDQPGAEEQVYINQCGVEPRGDYHQLYQHQQSGQLKLTNILSYVQFTPSEIQIIDNCTTDRYI